MVTWADRRLQRLVDGRRKKNKPPQDPGGTEH